MHCCLWLRSVFRVRGPWLKQYGYHLSIIIIKFIQHLQINRTIITKWLKLIPNQFITLEISSKILETELINYMWIYI